MKTKIALLGCGTVGTGIVRLLQENGSLIDRRDGIEFEITKILVKDLAKTRPGIDPALLTDQIDLIVNDPDISIVLEAMGGTDPALGYALKCLRAKKHYVTANKELMAKHWEELNAAAEAAGVTLSFEASAAGAIPIIQVLKTSMRANGIASVMGIINGTTNYILSKMTAEGTEYADALKEAQELGYAEPDPTADVEGFDAAYKLSILCALAFDARVKVDEIYREGISKISAIDIAFANELGYTVKLLGIGKYLHGTVQARVHPVMIPMDNPLASVGGPFNAVLVSGNASGDIMLYGRGAGDLPTASAMVSDALNAAHGNGTALAQFRTDLTIVSDFSSGYYIRTMAKDRPGVLGSVAGIFAKHGVSIESCVQKGRGEAAVPLIFVTHKAFDSEITAALKEIEALDDITVVSVIRVEK